MNAVTHSHGQTTCAALAEVFRNTKGKSMPLEFKPEVMESEDPLFILYTSGYAPAVGFLEVHEICSLPRGDIAVCRSTGKPKGVLHTTAGYMVWAATTFKHIFDTRPSAAPYPA